MRHKRLASAPLASYAVVVFGSVHTTAVPVELVVVAASAGAVPMYREIFGRLDRGLLAPVVLVQHRPPGDRSLAEILSRRAALDVREPAAQERLQDGMLYVAPANAQLRFGGRREAVLDPLAEDARAHADPVLISAAAAYGAAVLAVVLSGRLEDGAAGVRAVKHAGGRVIVQDPRTAAHPSMPWAALGTGCVDVCLPPRAIADAIRAFVAVPGAAALFASRPAPWASVDVG
jgi:two-component system chemotaxis response regulator CheB